MTCHVWVATSEAFFVLSKGRKEEESHQHLNKIYLKAKSSIFFQAESRRKTDPCSKRKNNFPFSNFAFLKPGQFILQNNCPLFIYHAQTLWATSSKATQARSASGALRPSGHEIRTVACVNKITRTLVLAGWRHRCSTAKSASSRTTASSCWEWMDRHIEALHFFSIDVPFFFYADRIACRTAAPLDFADASSRTRCCHRRIAAH